MEIASVGGGGCGISAIARPVMNTAFWHLHGPTGPKTSTPFFFFSIFSEYYMGTISLITQANLKPAGSVSCYYSRIFTVAHIYLTIIYSFS